MNSTWLTGVFVCILAAGCGQPFFSQSRSVEPHELNYIYVVEQLQNGGSRIHRCEIQANNELKCATQFKLD
jgi:hypothetical protein